MKAAIYNPYWDTFGGGERYTLSVALVLANNGFNVDIEWQDSTITQKLEQRFGLKLKNIHFVPDVKKGSNYDVCFWVSDGSIPLLYARKNLLHFQIPFKFSKASNLMNRMKLMRVRKVVCNSNFTKDFIDNSFNVDSTVLYPPVDIKKFKSKKKENLIIYVGRFSSLTQAKRQDVLVDTFKKLHDEGTRNWRLVLAGGVEVGADAKLVALRESAKGYPIRIMESPSFKELVDLYGKAKIFWSAAGFGVEENKEPSKLEHFGITVVEAMVSKAIPIVYKGGGHKEIIENGENGFLWSSQDEFLEITKNIINKYTSLTKVARNGFESSKKYSYETFEKELLALL